MIFIYNNYIVEGLALLIINLIFYTIFEFISYSNAMLFNCSATNLAKLQRVQNILVRVVCNADR